MLLALNGIPVIAIELKNQLTGQSVDDAKKQWAYNRNPKEPVFGFNKRILAYFACDLYDVYMTTRLDGPMTNFLPFNQGSNGAGRDGGAGNPPNPTGGYVTSYFWENVLQKDSPLDEIIARINEEFFGDFTDADRVMVDTLYTKMRQDAKVKKAAKSNDRQVHERSFFPGIFDTTAQQVYMENTEAYAQLFLDAEKYRIIQQALAERLYRELHGDSK